jgi:osmotically inducible lipoprotein OsmB
MRTTALALGLIAALTTPTLAMAHSHCEASSHERKVTGTVLGAAGGALIGGAIGHGAAGPLLGAAGGAVVGNQLARKKCTSYHSYYRRRHYHQG